MTARTLFGYLRRVRRTDDPVALARLQNRLEQVHSDDPHSIDLIARIATKRVRLVQSN